ncbi:MAG: EAL domain-containing protein [Acidovorax sp.]|nr:EAL domain-containing protein [Acidovorax sp.]
MDLSRNFQRRKDFLSLTPQDESALQRLHGLLGDKAPGFIESFYEHLLSFSETRALIPDEGTLARLKKSQSSYFKSLIAGVYDRAYLDDRLRVGLVHAKVGLSPGWYLGAYSHYLTELFPRIAQGLSNAPADELLHTFQALIKVVFLDVGLAIDSYIAHRDELIADLRDYGAAFANLPYGTMVATPDLKVVFANRAFEKLFSFAPNSLRGCPLANVMDVTNITILIDAALRQQSARDTVEVRPHHNPLAVPVSITAHTLPTQDKGQDQRLLLVFEDLREQTQLTRDLLNAQAVANIGTWQTHFDGNFALTPQAARLLGWPVAKPFTYPDFLTCVHEDDRQRVDGEWTAAQKVGRFRYECRVQSSPGVRWIEARGVIERDHQGNPIRGYGTVLDITERKSTEQAMERLAFYDSLTGLPNRTNGMMLAQQMLYHAQHHGQAAAVLFVDLDRFKEINDTHGHVVGDNVLAELATRFRAACAKDDVFARVGGDEFMCVYALAPGEDKLLRAQQLQAALARPVLIDSLKFEVGASIGVATFPDQGEDVEDLLKHADIAMYEIKARGGGSHLYSDLLGLKLERRISLGTKLARALAQSQLQLHYQPKVHLATGVLCGVEALSRWCDEDGHWISPGEFIPVAEERGLIGELGDWTLTQAARDIAHWQQDSAAVVPRVAVNVSATQMMDEGFAERAERLVRAQGVAPSMIELEMTESALMNEPEKARLVASSLVEAGFCLSIDDFGTGYSSLERLQSFPVFKLKIDMSFVRGMDTHAGNRAIVTAVIGMAKALKLETVAEGVETAAQAALLTQLDCDEAQGYLYSKAIPAEALLRQWLHSQPVQPAPPAAS